MGRGLSDLQKTILRIAYRNRTVEEDHYLNVTYAEVLHEHYHFPFRDNSWDTMPTNYIRRHGTACPIRTRLDLSEHQAFSRMELGSARYDRAEAAVAKAFTRLKGRGLIEPGCWSGWSREYAGGNLTEQGIKEAVRLLAKEATRCRLRSQYVAVWGKEALGEVEEKIAKPKPTPEQLRAMFGERRQQKGLAEIAKDFADFAETFIPGTSKPHPTMEDLCGALKILGCPCGRLTQHDLDFSYRERAKELHPDKGGDAKAFRQLQEAYELLKPFVSTE